MRAIGLGVGPTFNQGNLAAAIISLFAAGEQGFWYDPSDFSTLFQDSAGTTPVTAVGQPIGKVLDKSGRGNHLVQAVGASQMVLQRDANGFLHFLPDGVNDFLASAASVNLSSSSLLTVCLGIRKLSDAATGMVIESTTDSSANVGAFQVRAPSGAAANYLAGVRGTSFQDLPVASPYAAPITNVLTLQGDLANTTKLRVNGTNFSGAGGTGGGSFGNYTVYLGGRAGTSLFFSGPIYQVIGRVGATSAGDTATMEKYVGSKTGIAM